MEMYTHKSGYAPGEQFTTHARHRYRLLPPRNPNAPPIDSNLWITHYYSAEPQDRVPSSMIPMNDPRIQHMISTRNYLQLQGAIVRKEFMLRDQVHWPQIQWPQSGPARGPQYGAPVRTPQSMAYPPHAPVTAGPPAKRVRTNANAAAQPVGSAIPVEMMDDEEETSRGDMFDHMTPREISLARYKQNHRWLEEILSSPYAINQITPVDLGLGLKGELGSLTDGIFSAPSGDPENDPHQYDYHGYLDAGKADEFRNRVKERIAADNAEMEKMKAKHAKRLAKMKKGQTIIQAEKALRRAAHDPTDVGEEYWRLEGKIDEDENGEKSLPKTSGKVDDIVAQVEASLSRHTAAVEELRRLQDGGLEETVELSVPASLQNQGSHDSQQSGVMINENDIDMGESSAAGLLDQFHTGLSSASTPAANIPTPQGALLSGVGTPNVPSPQPAAPVQAPAITMPQVDRDAMQGMESNAPVANDPTKEGDEWVVVPKGGVSPVPAPAAAVPTISQAPEVPPSATPAPASQPVEDLAGLDLGVTPNTFNADTDFGDLADLDSAGDALAGFGDTDGGADLGLDLEMGEGLDDSAFGDAFHGVDTGRDEEGGDDGHTGI